MDKQSVPDDSQGDIGRELRLQALQVSVCEANVLLAQGPCGFLNYGNVSGIDRTSGIIVIKPSKMLHTDMLPDKMAMVDLSGNVHAGLYPPSVDTATHIEIYRHFPSIVAIAHTHSLFATAWAQANRAVPCVGTTHADNAIGSIPCTRYLKKGEVASDYEGAVGREIARTFAKRSYEDMPMVLIAGHGPFVWAETPNKAVERSIVLERICQLAYLTSEIAGRVKSLPPSYATRHSARRK